MGLSREGQVKRSARLVGGLPSFKGDQKATLLGTVMRRMAA